MEELGIPELTTHEIEKLCIVAEEAARRFILSKVPSKETEKLDITAEAEGTRPINLEVDINVELSASTSMKSHYTQKLVDDAIEQAFEAAREYLRELACHSRK